jgi:CBS domain-containing protein
MAEKNIGAVLVMKAGRLVGILSERDCARRALLQDRPARQTSVVEIMTSPVIYCRPEFTLESCMAIMTENRVRHLPVLVDGKPVGMITLGDVVKEIISSQQNDIQRLENLVTGMELEQLE